MSPRVQKLRYHWNRLQYNICPTLHQSRRCTLSSAPTESYIEHSPDYNYHYSIPALVVVLWMCSLQNWRTSRRFGELSVSEALVLLTHPLSKWRLSFVAGYHTCVRPRAFAHTHTCTRRKSLTQFVTHMQKHILIIGIHVVVQINN